MNKHTGIYIMYEYSEPENLLNLHIFVELMGTKNPEVRLFVRCRGLELQEYVRNVLPVARNHSKFHVIAEPLILAESTVLTLLGFNQVCLGLLQPAGAWNPPDWSLGFMTRFPFCFFLSFFLWFLFVKRRLIFSLRLLCLSLCFCLSPSHLTLCVESGCLSYIPWYWGCCWVSLKLPLLMAESNLLHFVSQGKTPSPSLTGSGAMSWSNNSRHCYIGAQLAPAQLYVTSAPASCTGLRGCRSQNLSWWCFMRILLICSSSLSGSFLVAVLLLSVICFTSSVSS